MNNLHRKRQRTSRNKLKHNGSRRKSRVRNKQVRKWIAEGLTIGSINIRGLTFKKIYTILGKLDADILCIQETWMSPLAVSPKIDGYKIIEERRKDSTRGGIAIYVRNKLTVTWTKSNEYCILAKITLPNSRRINIANIYLPPTSSLKRRQITDEQATTAIEDIIDHHQPQLTTVLCGDFNARIGNNVTEMDPPHPPRSSSDQYICPRAKWFLQFCAKYTLYILNGTHTPATCTCHASRGESIVDYILCNIVSLQVQMT